MKKLFLLSFCLILTACVKTVFHQYSPIQKNIWRFADKKQFHVKIDKDGYYDVSISIRNTDEYEWNNLWLNLQEEKPDGKTEKERFNFKLADIAGHWLGRGPGKLHDQS